MITAFNTTNIFGDSLMITLVLWSYIVLFTNVLHMQKDPVSRGWKGGTA